MTTGLPSSEIEALWPLALGHDQDASACPWVQLTRRTADYPSRKAQAALAVASGAAPIAPDLVDVLYRCDGCGRCLAASTLPRPPDLGRALWQVRASLVAAGAVPEVGGLAELHRADGSVYGDLGPAFSRLGLGDDGADVLFLPGTAVLHQTPEAAAAALHVARLVAGPVAIDDELLDSGQEMLELGLADEAGSVRDALRRRVSAAGYRSILAGTPKDALGLRDALVGLPVEVGYVGTAFASAVLSGRPSLPGIDRGTIAVHASEALLHGREEFEVIDRWLGSWLGERYRREADPRRNAWPAAIERPAVRVPPDLTRALAERRLAQLLASPGVGEVSVVLTCDPWSWRALREVAPAGIEVVDLLVFVTRSGQGAPAGD